MNTTINYATYKSPGRLESLKKSVDSVIDQVDLVRIYWNDYNYFELPKWAKENDKISNGFGQDLTDNGKFASIPFMTYDEYYFMGDDDLLYPPDYIAYGRAHLNYHPIITYHGRVLNTTGNWLNSYYRGGHFVYSFNNDVLEGLQVDIAGTGVGAFDSSIFSPSEIWRSEYKRMSDLVFSVEAAKQNIPIFVIPHKGNWIKQIRTEQSICTSQQNADQSEQIELVKEILILQGKL